MCLTPGLARGLSEKKRREIDFLGHLMEESAT